MRPAKKYVENPASASVVDLPSSRLAGNRVIADHSKSQVQTFLDEIKNGTRNYRTVASLGAQVAQEYRGRCVLELLQNAHDALAEPGPNDLGRITFVLSTSPQPVLLVANTGRPFHHEDFKGMCQLAQSPKDPNESVGNKGLGFRSVLEVSRRPEIWSTAPVGGDMCFAFGFDPAVIDKMDAAVRELELRGIEARSPFDPDVALVDWSREQLVQFRQSVAKGKIEVTAETKHLWPYQLPFPIGVPPRDVQRLLDIGHATVVRLPLESEDAVHSVRRQLDGLRDAPSVVFLDRLAQLVLEVEDDRYSLTRTVRADTPLSGNRKISHRCLQVKTHGTSCQGAGLHQFHLWSSTIGGHDDPVDAKRVRDAVAHLPNRWPEVRQAKVGLAVEDTAAQVDGTFVIFLPTDQVTGTGAHINAPFFGSLDRRRIDFGETYNRLLLDTILDLCLDAVDDLACGAGEAMRARAAIDILASVAPVGGEQWSLLSRLSDRAEQRGNPLTDRAIVLCDTGWRSPQEARLMPDVDGDEPVGPRRWRNHAKFEVVSGVLDGRRNAVTELIKGLGGSVDPTDHEWVNTVEQVAQHVGKGDWTVTWDGFLRSLLATLPEHLRLGPIDGTTTTDLLQKTRFLPTSDGRLIAASGSVKLFFPPRGDDAAEPVDNVPHVLQRHLAFLHPEVRLHDRDVRGDTDVRKFLDDRFARTWRSEDILREVVIPALPSLPASHHSPEAEQCAAILEWTSRLWRDEPPDTTLLRRLPVSCGSGWRHASDAVFGLGWPGRHGEDVVALANGLGDREGRRLSNSALCPPDDERWLVGNVVEWCDFLVRLGVVDGLRLLRADDVNFSMEQTYSSELPKRLPSSDTPAKAWLNWYKAVGEELRPPFVRPHEYSLSGIRLLPAIHQIARLDERGRRALSDLILRSVTHWEADWVTVTVEKKHGQSWRAGITSPLRYWLQGAAWLHDLDGAAKPLSRRWLVPESLLRGQRDRYAHLDPLSLDLVKRISAQPMLRESLVMLGLNVYPTDDDRTGPELLDALAEAWTNGRVPSARFDAFVGQVREAWSHFDPDNGFPDTFLVRSDRRSFSTCELRDMPNVFLPDNRSRVEALREHGKGILEMGVRDARRVAEPLVAATGVSRASKLREEHTIDGVPWSGEALDVTPLDAGKYHWLPIVLLCVAAHGGANPAGPSTTVWANAADRIRRAALSCAMRSGPGLSMVAVWSPGVSLSRNGYRAACWPFGGTWSRMTI